jgi:hypothetical protein
MKKAVHSAGRGVRAAKRFLAHVARGNGAKLKTTGDDFILCGGNLNTDVRIPASPANYLEWNSRFEWLEKLAASFLLRAPLAYSARLRTVAGQATGQALRLSFGLSLSLGQPLRKRFSAYVFSSGSKPQLFAPDDESIEELAEVKLLSQMPVWATKIRLELIPLLQEACEKYRSQVDVQEAIATLAKKRKESLWYLDNLYRRREGSHDRIYGWPPVGSSGSAAISQEYKNCQANILRRFSVSIEIMPLSLGVLSPSASKAQLS